jgi:DNA mismatch repair protein MutL
VFGKQYSQDLLPVEADTAMCRVSGFVAKPEAARKKGGQDYFFVNGRYMKHPYFHKAVITAYERLVPEGMQVPYFLYFDIRPEDIDVNIHPTKTEIKFENEQAIWQIIVAAVRDAIGRFNEIPSIDFDTEGRPDIPVFDPARDNIQIPRVNYNPDYNPFMSTSSSSGTGSPVHGTTPKAPSGWESLYEGVDVEPEPEQQTFSLGLLTDKSPVHYQYKGKYIMTAVKSGLMIIDQHRADIRILYERYMSQQTSKVVGIQQLLFPETLQLSPADAVVMEQISEELAALGFDISNLGGNTYAVNGIPAGLDGLAPATLLQQLVSEAADHDAALSKSLHLSISQSLNLTLARAAAIPYGQLLTNEEMEGLVNSLFACSNVNYTPDGKAILCILPQTDIEHLLG